MSTRTGFVTCGALVTLLALAGCSQRNTPPPIVSITAFAERLPSECTKLTVVQQPEAVWQATGVHIEQLFGRHERVATWHFAPTSRLYARTLRSAGVDLNRPVAFATCAFDDSQSWVLAFHPLRAARQVPNTSVLRFSSRGDFVVTAITEESLALRIATRRSERPVTAQASDMASAPPAPTTVPRETLVERVVTRFGAPETTLADTPAFARFVERLETAPASVAPHTALAAAHVLWLEPDGPFLPSGLSFVSVAMEFAFDDTRFDVAAAFEDPNHPILHAASGTSASTLPIGHLPDAVLVMGVDLKSLPSFLAFDPALDDPALAGTLDGHATLLLNQRAAVNLLSAPEGGPSSIVPHVSDLASMWRVLQRAGAVLVLPVLDTEPWHNLAASLAAAPGQTPDATGVWVSDRPFSAGSTRYAGVVRIGSQSTLDRRDQQEPAQPTHYDTLRLLVVLGLLPSDHAMVVAVDLNALARGSQVGSFSGLGRRPPPDSAMASASVDDGALRIQARVTAVVPYFISARERFELLLSEAP